MMDNISISFSKGTLSVLKKLRGVEAECSNDRGNCISNDRIVYYFTIYLVISV